jgi:hypothetical protein
MNEAVVSIFIAGRNAAILPKKMFESIRLEFRSHHCRRLLAADRRGAHRRADLGRSSEKARACRLMPLLNWQGLRHAGQKHGRAIPFVADSTPAD